MEKFEFNYIAKTDCTVLGFPADLLYEDERFREYRFIIDKAWRVYE